MKKPMVFNNHLLAQIPAVEQLVLSWSSCDDYILNNQAITNLFWPNWMFCNNG